MEKHYKEAIKELARTAILAAIPTLIMFIQNWEIDWRVLAIAIIIPVLRATDKMLHVKGKADNSRLMNGLTRF